MTGRLLTAREVAEQLGVTPATVLRWTRLGHLPAIRLPGGAVRYDGDEVGAWLRARATPGRGAVPPTPRPDVALASTVPSLVPPTPDDEE
jgi:excisionase family DNA binding protein